MSATKHKSILAVDIDAREVRAAFSERLGGHWTAARLARLKLPDTAGDDEGRRLALRGALSEICCGFGGPEPEVYAALPKNQVFLRILQLPKAGRKELRDMLALRAPKEIPQFDAASVVWDFEVLPGQHGDPSCRVLLCAVRRKALDERLADFAAAGVSPLVIDAEPLAMARWFLAQRKGRTREGAVVDLDDTCASIVSYSEGGIAQFAQTPMTGGDLRAGGAAAERFAQELQMALRAPGGGGTSAPMGEIALCGDSDLCALLTESIRALPGAGAGPLSECVEPGREGALISPALIQENNHILAALLYRAVTRRTGLANLAPPRVAFPQARAFIERTTNMRTLIPAAAILALLFFFIGPGIRWLRGSMLGKASVEAKALAPQLAQMEGAFKTLKAYEAERCDWLGVFRELTRVQPRSITLTQLSMARDGKVSLQGTVRGAPPMQTVSTFATQLEESEYFSKVQLGATRAKENKEAAFSLTCQLGAPKSKKGKPS